MPKKNSDDYSVVIYFSDEDECWIAHDVDLDQIGTGQRVVDALADLIRAVEAVFAVARKDHSINLFREAPPEVRRLMKSARPLPAEVYEVAFRMVHGKWPDTVRVDVAPDLPDRPMFKTRREPVCA